LIQYWSMTDGRTEVVWDAVLCWRAIKTWSSMCTLDELSVILQSVVYIIVLYTCVYDITDLLPFLAHQPSPHWKSQITHSDMHHPVCGINSRILSVSLASHVSTHLLIHLSAHLYYHHHSHHPSLLHSFPPGSKPTFSTNPSLLRLLLPTGLPSWQRDWTGPIMLIVLFLVSHFNFLFVPCGRQADYPSALYCTLNTHYRIVSYRIVFPDSLRCIRSQRDCQWCDHGSVAAEGFNTMDTSRLISLSWTKQPGQSHKTYTCNKRTYTLI